MDLFELIGFGLVVFHYMQANNNDKERTYLKYIELIKDKYFRILPSSEPKLLKK